jgi:ATP-binding cassette, subfamily B, bacterial MsbA
MAFEKLRNRLSRVFSEDARVIVPRLLATDGRKHAWRYARAFFFMALVAGCTAFSAWLMKDVVNKIFVDGNYTAIWVLGFTLLGLFTVKGLATYGQTMTMSRIGNRIIADYQRRMFDAMLAQGIPFFSSRHSTDFLNRMSAGANASRVILDLVITSLGRDLLTLIGLVIVMVMQDPVIMIVGAITLPLSVHFIRNLSRRARQVVSRQFANSGEYLKQLQESIQGIRIVKSYNLENEMRARMSAVIAQTEQNQNYLARYKAMASPMMDMLGGFAIAGFVMYAGHGVLRGSQLPGEFFSVVTALLLAYEPAKKLSRLHVDLAANLTMARFMFDILDSSPAEKDDDKKPKIEIKQARIEFRDVSFRYRTDEAVLRGVSFIAEPGQTTALVGSSGAGKSTVMSLVERFWDPQTGKIFVDNQDIAQVSRQSLRANIAYVSQDVFLFTGSVRDNIALGKLDATEEEIVRAAKAAHAHDFIAAFPQGYNSPVGEHGVQVSGGQRARISIARAFLKNSPILLLDEPTAALDSESEREVQRALESLQASRTTLVIAHRLQTIMSADKICVMDEGRVVETGKHDELIAHRGRYYDLYQTQFKELQTAIA